MEEINSELKTPNGDTPESQPTVTPSPVPIPRETTLSQFKALRAKYFTVRHKRMEPCGHRLDQINEPRHNCEYCWFAFFQTHGELVQTTDRAYQEQGAAFVDKMRGIKYRKMFLRFMSTIQMFKSEIEAAKGQDGQAGEDQGGPRVGQDAGQEVRIERDISNAREESGPVASDIPDPIAVV
jgi:hypothetical protein